MKTTNAETGDQPLVDPIGESRQHFVSGGDHEAVKLVEVKAMPHGTREEANFFRDGIGFGSAVDGVGKRQTKSKSSQPSQRSEWRICERRKKALAKRSVSFERRACAF